MKKVAKLVCVSLMTRVVVDENASERDIINKAKSQLLDQLENDIHDNIESIEDDEECPYDPEHDGILFDILKTEYAKSDVTSGQMIYSVELPLEDFTEFEVRTGIQAFLDWDESSETFDVIKGENTWKIIEK